MCLLTFLPAGVLPDTTALLNGTVVNDDGHGFAIVADGRIIVHRGMSAEDTVDAFDAARRQHPDGPALFHSRFSTHGATGIDNCHPFAVGGDLRTVLAHNGVLPDKVRPGKGDERSDTRITAEDFLPAFGSLRSRRARSKFQQWMTTYNKIVILTVDRRFKEQSYILNETAGIWDGGIWYSNGGYLPSPIPARGRWSTNSPWDEWASWAKVTDDLDRCGLCYAMVDSLEGECRYCGWCLDCRSIPEDCSCYIQPTLTPRARPARNRW